MYIGFLRILPLRHASHTTTPLLIHSLTLFTGVWKIDFSPVDRVLVSGSADRTLRLWSVADYSCLRSFEGHTASVLCTKFVRKGMQVLSGSADGLVRLWNVSSGECVNTFDQHEDKIWSLAAPSDADLATAAKWVSGASSGDEGATLPTPQSFFVSGGSDSCLRQWVDCTQEEESKRLEEQEQLVLHSQQLDNDIRQGKFSKVSTADSPHDSSPHLTCVGGIMTLAALTLPADTYQCVRSFCEMRESFVVGYWGALFCGLSLPVSRHILPLDLSGLEKLTCPSTFLLLSPLRRLWLWP
jgi:hypothetical protein